MAVRVAVANHKGGVGKSTTAMMLAEGLALRHGLRVLAIDLDPQASLSAMLLSSAGVRAAFTKERTLWHLLKDLAEGRPAQFGRAVTTKATDLAELRDPGDARRVDIIASSSELLSDYHEFEAVLRRRYGKVRLDEALANALSPELHRIDRNYDAIVFDCPAGAVPLGLTAIRSSQIVLAPTVLDDVSLRALKDFINVILKDDLGVYGHLVAFKVLVTMFVRTNPDQRAILEHITSGLYKLNALPRPIGHSVNVQRAVTRLRPDSFRSASEKYCDALGDVALLAGEILALMQPKAKVMT